MHIARERIDPDADKVVRRLARHGYQAYLVGGCVRDLLLNRTPKDFDVATSATPNEIKQLFKNCRIIGRRFRLAHIFFGGKIIETSTFRANPRQGEGLDESEELLIRRDNVFGTDTEDARRRDFTINGLFYDVEAEKVIDHVHGLEDLRSHVVSTIGDPNIRFREDPVRMLRAIKFAARLDFDIEPETYRAIVRHRGEINKCAQPRVVEEIYRLLRGGAARRSLELAVQTGIAAMMSPRLASLFSESAPPISAAAEKLDEEEAAWMATWADQALEPSEVIAAPAAAAPGLSLSFLDEATIAEHRALAWRLLDQIDERVQSGASLGNGLLLASLAAPFVFDELLADGVRPIEANEMIHEVLEPLMSQLQVARRDAERARQLLLAQRRLAPSRRRRGKPMALVRRDYFDEAMVLYELVGTAKGRDTSEDLAYWRSLRTQDSEASQSRGGGSKRRRRRRGGRRRRRTTLADERPGGASCEPAIGG